MKGDVQIRNTELVRSFRFYREFGFSPNFTNSGFLFLFRGVIVLMGESIRYGNSE